MDESLAPNRPEEDASHEIDNSTTDEGTNPLDSVRRRLSELSGKISEVESALAALRDEIASIEQEWGSGAGDRAGG